MAMLGWGGKQGPSRFYREFIMVEASAKKKQFS